MPSIVEENSECRVRFWLQKKGLWNWATFASCFRTATFEAQSGDRLALTFALYYDSREDLSPFKIIWCIPRLTSLHADTPWTKHAGGEERPTNACEAFAKFNVPNYTSQPDILPVVDVPQICRVDSSIKITSSKIPAKHNRRTAQTTEWSKSFFAMVLGVQ
jgi:hypothetical protein